MHHTLLSGVPQRVGGNAMAAALASM